MRKTKYRRCNESTPFFFLSINAKYRAFTLIELLIVVAIIAILAAIAVPNFLEAQTRSKVSRALADIATLTTTLEAYAVDNNRYPPHAEILDDDTYNFPATAGGLPTIDLLPPVGLTTPITYISSLPNDVFDLQEEVEARRLYGYVQSQLISDILRDRGFISSADAVIPTYGGWRLYSAGPDQDKGADTKLNILYDSSNGTISNGDIIRSQVTPRITTPGDE